jgi:endonuclease/exonuclease/phosphatase family metal-dependent hydrolase
MGPYNYNYGVAVIWRRQTFTLERDRSGIMGTNDVFVAAELRWTRYPGRQNVLVYGVHLSSGETQAREHDRLQEIQTVLNYVRLNAKDRMILLMGDFNTDPFNTSHVTSLCIPEVLKFVLDTKDTKTFFRSVYDLPASSDDALFTTMKERAGNAGTRQRVSAGAKGAVQRKRNNNGDFVDVDKSGLSKRVIDYIFAAGDAFAVTQTLAIPSEEALREQGMVIPSRWYPSDHFAIAARLKITRR